MVENENKFVKNKLTVEQTTHWSNPLKNGIDELVRATREEQTARQCGGNR
jgi:hypothetical protein